MYEICCTVKESGFWTMSIVRFLKNMFRKLDLFPSSGKMKVAPTLLGPFERASLSHWTTSVRNIRFLKRCVFEKTLDDGQSPKT
jgi:hypothetical protein